MTDPYGQDEPGGPAVAFDVPPPPPEGVEVPPPATYQQPVYAPQGQPTLPTGSPSRPSFLLAGLALAAGVTIGWVVKSELANRRRGRSRRDEDDDE